MENSRQNTRFHWRDAKRIEALAQTMDSDGTNVELGGNLEVDGAITQNKANWEANIETIPLPTSTTDLSAAVINYAGVKQINSVLYLALSFAYSNATESAISMNYNNRINIDIVDIPESVSSKIFDVNGVALSSTGASYAMIVCDTGNMWINSSYYRCKVRISRFSTEANKIRIVLEPDSAMSVTAGSKLNVDARTFLVTL